MDASKIAIRNTKVIALCIAVLMLYLTYAFVAGVADKKFQLLELERTNLIGVANLEYVTAVARTSERHILSRPELWRASVLDYRSAEVYPLDPKTGKSFFPSSLTGTISVDDLGSLGKTTEVENRIVLDHRGLPVLRVTGLRRIGGRDAVINADMDVFEVIYKHGHRLLLHALIFGLCLFFYKVVDRMSTAINSDGATFSFNDLTRYRMMQEAIEALKVGVIIAEYFPDTGENKIVLTTRRFNATTGYERDELVGKSLEIFLPKERAEWHRSKVAGVATDHKNVPLRRVLFITRSGETKEIYLDVDKTAHVMGVQYLVGSTREIENDQFNSDKRDNVG